MGRGAQTTSQAPHAQFPYTVGCSHLIAEATAEKETGVSVRIDMTFEGAGPDAGHGVDIDDVLKAAGHFKSAVRHVVAEMAGVDISRGRPSDEIRAQSTLRLLGSSHGSLIAHFEIGPPMNDSLTLEDRSEEAVAAICDAQSRGYDGLPPAARGELVALSEDLPDDIATVTIGEQKSGRQFQVKRQLWREPRRHHRDVQDQETLMHGWLREINWAQGTAQLHNWSGGYVTLTFEPSLAGKMRRHATEFVRVSGHGRINEADAWGKVQVLEITPAGSFNAKPFDLDAFLNDPDPKIFDPDKLVKIDLSDEEYESFIRAIEEGRGE